MYLQTQWSGTDSTGTNRAGRCWLLNQCTEIKIHSNLPGSSLSPLFIKLCWWWFSESAGHRFTLTASCGVSSMTGLTATCKSLSTCTSSLGCFSTSAQRSTQSSTTSCPHASEKCLKRSCAIGHITSPREHTRSASPG